MGSRKNPFAGLRVHLSPALDLFMRGATSGTVRKLEIAGNGAPMAVVKMDHPGVKTLQRIWIKYLSAKTSRFIGPKNVTTSRETHLLSGQTVYLINFVDDLMVVTPDVVPDSHLAAGPFYSGKPWQVSGENVNAVLVFNLGPDDLERQS